ncbi:MAG: tetratricopeptide repeat protein [Kofleriaceae bacterium]
MLRVAAIVAVMAGIAVAQAPTDGAKLFEEGRELAKQNKYAEALTKFEQSYALDNGVGTELNLADCHEHLGHFAAAWRMFEEAAQRSADTPAKQKFAHERADGIVGKLATAVVNLPEPDAPGLSITIAGRAVKASATITERVDPGQVAVHVATPARTLFDSTKAAAAGATVIFDVPTPPVAFPDQGHRDDEIPHAVRRRSRVYLAYGIGGAGLVTFGASVVMGFKARSDSQAAKCPFVPGGYCEPDGRQRANDAVALADLGTIVGTVGVVALAAGVVLYVTAPKDLVVAPMASNQTAGVAISGRF